MNIERLVVQNLIKNEEFTRKVLPHIRKDYFETGGAERIAFELAAAYFLRYDRLPTPEALAIDLQNRTDISDDQFSAAASLLGEVTEDKSPAQDIRYLTDQTETWCKDRALYLAMTKAMEIMADKGDKGLSKGSIPKLMQDALAVSFDVHIGHDYFPDTEKQYDYYHSTVSHLPFDLEKFNEITLGGVLPKTLNVGMAVSGAGKAQPLDTKMPSPKGEIRFGDLKLGDEVFGSNGLPTKVIGIFPQGPKDVYDITFFDGRTVRCCGEHLWDVYDRSTVRRHMEKPGYRTMTTTEILQRWEYAPSSRSMCYVQVTRPVEYSKKDLPIHPYLMGALLGDGSTMSGSIIFTNDDESVIARVREVIPDHAIMTKRSELTYSINPGKSGPRGRNAVLNAFRKYDLMFKPSHEKHIPTDYMESSSDDRFEILRGLLDTDGTIGTTGNVTYASTSEVMAKQVQSIVFSLGGTAKITNRRTSYTHNGERRMGRIAYQVSIVMDRENPLFYSEKKKARYDGLVKDKLIRLRIVDIKKVGVEECQCIAVDADDSLYLTTNFVVTHNTLIMVHFAAAYLMQGKNVLYITHEIAEERIRERIDANLLDTDIPDLQKIPRDVYLRKIETMRNKTLGNLRIKEYPPHGAGAAHYRHLLHELKTKQNFIPDVIFIDYINICAATTLGKGDVNSYERVKRIAEELRGLAVEQNVPIWSATQTNRGGYGSSDVGMDDVSDSMGLPMTVDLLFAIVRDETLDKLGQMKIIQLKSRYDDLSKQRVFFVGVNKVRMKLYDLEDSAQPGSPEIVIPPTRIPGSDKPSVKFEGFR